MAVKISTNFHARGELNRGLNLTAPNPSAEKKIKLARVAPMANGKRFSGPKGIERDPINITVSR